MPPPSRERLSRPVDISTLFRGAARTVDLKVDEPGLRWAGLSGNPTRSVSRSPSSGGQRAGRNTRRPLGLENRAPGRAVRSGRGRGRGRGRVLPHWYPRTPLRDITAIVRAIERRRAELHLNDPEIEATQEETNAPASSSTSSAQLEHESVGGSTLLPTLSAKYQSTPSTQIEKILSSVPDKSGENSNFITPQKRLLDSIDEVREVLVEERKKLEKTPAAKKAEREKRVRTLMSMR